MNDKLISYEDALEYAVKSAVVDAESYWSSKSAKKIINDDTFEYIWKKFPEHKESMLSIAMGSSSATSSYYEYAITKGFAEKFLSKTYKDLSEREDLSASDLEVMLRLQPIVDNSYNYLEALLTARLNSDEKKCEIIERHGLSKSTDSEFYDFCFENVPRKQGGTDIKYGILEKAYNNNSLSEIIIRKIAKSSPISLKRKVSELLSADLSSMKSDNRYLSGGEKEKHQKRMEHSEGLLMLFVDVADYNVISSMLDVISKDNIPWIMPSVSKINRSYLTRRVERIIESL